MEDLHYTKMAMLACRSKEALEREIRARLMDSWDIYSGPELVLGQWQVILKYSPKWGTP